MKTTHKVSSLVSSVVIAFAITMFTPSASQATWGSSSDSSSNSKKCYTTKSTKHYKKSTSSSSSNSDSSASSASSSSDKGDTDSSNCSKYKELAAKYLKSYYKCYNYTYYKKYLYYTKKAKACQPAVTVDCDKYKVLADKYLAAYNKCGYSCYYKYYQYYLNLYNKCQTNVAQTGKVCGKVFEDTNENGEFDSSDARLGNVTVNITDSEGKITTVTTNNDGYYCASDIATGTASVDIVDSSLPENPTQVVGTDPTEVEVKANANNWEEYNGYTFPQPTGNVCGVVYEDINANGQQDDNETGVADIDVTIIDANGVSYTVPTDVDGKYCQSDIPEGSASITVDEETLPEGATLTAGENPNDITVVAGQDNNAGTDGYTLPTPVGNACGYVLVDDQGQSDVTVNLLDSEGTSHSETTDNDGKYCFQDIPQGEATVDVDDTTLPDGAELTSGEDPSDVTVVANEDNDAGTDAYTLPIPVGTVCGSVLVDGEGEANVTVNIEDVNGEIHTTTTDADGQYCVPGIPEGDSTITVDETTLPAGVTQVVGENPNTIPVTANENNDAGIDGYETPVLPGSTCGLVVIDSNKNGGYDTTDRGIEGVTVSITDAEGEVYVRTTNANGLWCVDELSAGNATADVDESTLPDGAEQVFGMDPSTVYIIPGLYRSSLADGYVLPEATCPA